MVPTVEINPKIRRTTNESAKQQPNQHHAGRAGSGLVDEVRHTDHDRYADLRTLQRHRRLFCERPGHEPDGGGVCCISHRTDRHWLGNDVWGRSIVLHLSIAWKGGQCRGQSNRLHRSFCQHFCRSGHYRRDYGIPQPCADVAGSDRHDFALCESLRPNLCDWLHHQCVYRHNEQPSDGAGCYPVHHDLYAHRQYHQHHFRPDYDLCPGLGH